VWIALVLVLVCGVSKVVCALALILVSKRVDVPMYTYACTPC